MITLSGTIDLLHISSEACLKKKTKSKINIMKWVFNDFFHSIVKYLERLMNRNSHLHHNIFLLLLLDPQEK